MHFQSSVTSRQDDHLQPSSHSHLQGATAQATYHTNVISTPVSPILTSSTQKALETEDSVIVPTDTQLHDVNLNTFSEKPASVFTSEPVHSKSEVSVLPSFDVLTKMKVSSTSANDATSYLSPLATMVLITNSANATQPSQGITSISSVLESRNYHWPSSQISLNESENQGESSYVAIISEAASSHDYSQYLWSQSAVHEDHFSVTETHVTLSHIILPTAVVDVTASSTSVSLVVQSSTSATTASSHAPQPTPAPTHPETSQEKVKTDTPEGISQGAKIAIGAVVTVFVLGVIITGFVLYRR